ncbi:MarR family transcriptional regulator [Nitrosopumilus sp. b2]|uniref:helix-turn-helix transcriptional regulator n=1 Tax=Nitrosopumilus sp. b2 TaxID=2109908 RepID=UPI0015F69BF9|nr:MarR family transcriptional regulator [Nitrosopumilus sp. b2]KAF6245977.1 MarR family transcriptional regulator [Nitrosopumilus sp. b2]
MNPQIVPIYRTEFREDGMLFVRTDSIIDTMVNAPLIVAGLLVVALTIPLQTSFATTRTLDLIINTDGSTHISSQIDVNSSNYELSLFGPSIDNFFAIAEDGTTLSGNVIEDKAVIQTSDYSSITVNYDIHDLISKEGRVWTFSFDSPTNYSLLMPENSVIVGMNILPENMEQLDSQIKLEIPTGPAQIDYIFSTPADVPATPSEFSFDSVTIGLIVGSIAAAAIASVIVAKKRQSKPQLQTNTIQTTKPTKLDSLNPETIFKLRPDMREDDKEIVKFISENDGQVFESDLRKKFLQPRTTMWRAVKRLERLGVVEIYKKDLLNMVKLRNDLEEEN